MPSEEQWSWVCFMGGYRIVNALNYTEFHYEVIKYFL